jgi:phosphodiesterase/alkaline phosphatase D-like protein
MIAPSALALPHDATVNAFRVQEYRKDFPGLTKSQAEARLRTQQRGAGIVNQLKRDLGLDYAGTWFDNEAGEFVVPMLPGANRGSVHAELTGAQLEDSYRTSAATHSWVELEAAHERIDSELLPIIEKALVQTSLDPRTNAIVVDLAQGASKGQRDEVERLASGEDVRVEIRKSSAENFRVELRGCKTSAPRVCDKPLRGGVGIGPDYEKEGIGNIGLCSAGFKAIGKYTGSRYLLTAGHCAASFSNWASMHTGGGEEAEKPIGSVAEYNFPGGDWARITANGSYWDTSPWPSMVAHYWGNQATPVYYEAYTYLGQYVCHSGTNTGTSCGNVLALDVTVSASGVVIYHETKFGEVCGVGGDSGGPAFAGNTALGIYNAAEPNGKECPPGSGLNNGETGYYTEITEATNDLGVDVGTRIGGEPDAKTGSASGLQPYKATLNGQVNPNSVETSYRFEWGKTCYCQDTSEGSAGYGASWVSKSATITGLDPTTKYKFRIRARSAAGTDYGSEATFTTPSAPPKATTEGVSNIRAEEETGKATLHGKVNPGGTATGYRFEWGTVASGEFPNSAPVPDGEAGSGIAYTPAQAGIEGLKSATEYHYRLRAENSEGADTGSVKKFTTPAWRPAIIYQFPSDVMKRQAALHAVINPSGFATDYYFEYSKQTDFEVQGWQGASLAPAEPKAMGSGTNNVAVAEAIDGLDLETKYRFRVVAINGNGQSTGEGQTFTTLGPVVTLPASAIEYETATLNADISPLGTETAYQFEYGPTTTYGSTVPATPQSVGSGEEDVLVDEGIEGLTHNTVYHYRVVATKGEEVIYGEDRTLNTLGDTETSVELDDVLHGEPGTVTVSGEVLAENGATSSIHHVDVNFSKWDGEKWVYDHTASPAPTLGGGKYELRNWPIEHGLWRVKVAFPEQGALQPSESKHLEFEIGDGYHLVVQHSGKCLAFESGSAAEGADTIQWTCSEQASQTFTLEPIGGGYHLIARHSNMCIDVPGGSTEPGVQLHQGICRDSSVKDMIWDKNPVSAEYNEFIVQHAGLCLTVDDWSTSNGAEVIQYTCNGSNNKYWKLVPVDFAPYQPGATTQGTSGITTDAATLHATINPNGSTTSYELQYTRQADFEAKGWEGASSAPAEPKAIGSGETGVEVEETIEGLDPDTEYRYRVVASNAEGQTFGEGQTFATLTAILTLAASEIGYEIATLNASINPLGTETAYQFEYGPTTTYGSTVPATPQSVGSGEEDVLVDEGIEGLTHNTVYHYRVVATKGEEVIYGEDRTLNTLGDTETSVELDDVLHGEPGTVTVSGEVLAENGATSSIHHVDVNFSKWDGEKWVYDHTASPAPTLGGGKYELRNWPIEHGLWRVKVAFPEQGALQPSESKHLEFEIGDGYHLVVQHSGKCLAFESGSAAEGADTIQWTCSEQASQTFTLEPIGGGYHLIARHSNMCIDVPGGSTEPGVQLHQGICRDSSVKDMIWDKNPVSAEYNEFIVQHAGLCLTVDDWSTSNGAEVIQYTCNGSNNKYWKLVPVDFAPYQPGATTQGTSGITTDAATLHATINPNGSTTSYELQYTRQADFEAKGWEGASSAPAEPKAIGSGETGVEVEETIEGLDPDTEYRYRVVASNAEGQTFGEGQTFATLTASNTSTLLEEMAVTEPFDGGSESLADFNSDWSTLGWAGGGTPKGSNTTSGWRPVDAFATALNGAYHEPIVADSGSGTAAIATMNANPAIAERYFSAWLHMPTPAGTKAGYELRFTYTATNTYDVALSKWAGGGRTVLASESGHIFENGDSFAIVDEGGTVSAWTNRGAGFEALLAAADATYSSGNAGIEGRGNIARLGDFKSGSLSGDTAARLDGMAVTVPFNGSSESQASFGEDFSKLGWAIGKGQDTTKGWGPITAFAYGPDGIYHETSLIDSGSGLAAVATLSVSPGLVGRYFSLWLDMSSPGSTRNGYELRFTYTATDTYDVELSKWQSGGKTVLDSSQDYSFSTGDSVALVDIGDTISAWTDTGLGFGQQWGASDGTFSSGNPGLESGGNYTRLSDFKVGVL